MTFSYCSGLKPVYLIHFPLPFALRLPFYTSTAATRHCFCRPLQLYGKPTGTFLIRVSVGRPGYCISLVFAGRFKHFRIEVTQDLGYVIRGKG